MKAFLIFGLMNIVLFLAYLVTYMYSIIRRLFRPR
jgi:hypothetical protein